MNESDKRIDNLYLSFAEWSKYIADEAIKKIKKDGYSVFFSNNGMKSPGGNIPISLLFQRTSASAPAMVSVAKSYLGW